jgi:hypothetical protein
MSKFTIRLDTGDQPRAGTNADVEARIGTMRDLSEWRALDNPAMGPFGGYGGDDREQGAEDYYKYYVDPHFNPVEVLELRVKKWDNDSPDWYLDSAFVADVADGNLYQFEYRQWIDPKSDWKTIRLEGPKLIGKIAPFDPFQW